MNLHSHCSATKPLISKQQLKSIAAILTLSILLPASLLGAETAPVDAGSDPRILPDLEQERLQALANSQLADTQTLWLESNDESFLGLLKLANHPSPVGAVVLLHHDRTSADWPGSITTLRQGLPDQGWHTLSIALPDEPEYIPPRTQDVILAKFGNPSSSADTSSAPAAASEDSDKLKDHFEQISARVEAGLVHLEALQPPIVLVLGEGSGAYWALRFSVDEQAGRRLFPVLIDALPPATPTQPALDQLVTQLKQPVLDLYHGNGLKQQRVEVLAQQRRDAAKRQGDGLLVSNRMSPRAGDWRQPDKRLLGVVRGMLPRLLATTPRGKLEAQRQQQE
ncbi:MAG: DUF3530 family protein [Halopseudomonas sp.]